MFEKHIYEKLELRVQELEKDEPDNSEVLKALSEGSGETAQLCIKVIMIGFLLIIGLFTGRVHAQDLSEKELRERNDELSTVLDAIPALVWIAKDPECNTITGNRFVNDMFGVVDETNVSQTAAKKGQAVKVLHLNPDGTELLAEELPMQQSIARGEAVRNVEFSYLFPDGRQVFAIGNAVPLFNEHGRIRGSVGAFLDITESKQASARLQKRTQMFLIAAVGFAFVLGVMFIVMARMWQIAKQKGEALRESEINFKTAIDQAPVSTEIYDLTGFQIQANKAWEKMWDAIPENVIGKFNLLTDPQMKKSPKYPQIKDAFTKHNSQFIEEWHFDPGVSGFEARARYMRSHIYPIRNEKGEVRNIVVTHEDITERKKAKEEKEKLETQHKLSDEQVRLSEKRLRRIIDIVPSMLFVKNMDGRFLLANKAVAESLDMTTQDLIGKLHTEIHPNPDEVNQMLRDDRKTFEKGKTVIISKESYTDADGNTRWLHTTKVPCKDEFGEPAIVGMATDITKRIEMEDELVQAHKMDAIGTMAGGIAHDFNNILAIIMGFSEMAMSNIPDLSPAKDDIGQILKASNRAKDLVSHILTFSRMASRGSEHVPIALSPIVKEVMKFQRSIIPATISILSNIDEKCGQINGDPTQIHQLIMNFCTNSSHAMEKQGGTLEVTLNKTELSSDDMITEPDLHPGRYIKLSVRDTGTGLTPKLIDKIFDPYFTTKEVGKGSGMGLSVVHGIVKGHGGFIKVESELGKGSTFNVFFPKIENEVVDDGNNEVEDLPTGTERILFVDDETMLAELGKSIIEKLGYSVTPMTDSIDALNLFKSDPSQFDLVITDQTMPNIPGSELAQKLLLLKPDIPIIICTGHSDTIDEIKAQKIGIKEFTMKPVNIAVIAKLIRKAFDSA